MLLPLQAFVVTLVLGGAFAGWLPFAWFERQAVWPPEPGWAVGLGGVLTAAGLGLYLHCAWLLLTRGQTTPLPLCSPRRLVQRGAYRWVRNPMDLALLLVVGGEAVGFRSSHLAVYWACLACGLQALVGLHEESALSQRFGAVYEDYRRGTPRWWPRRPRE